MSEISEERAMFYKKLGEQFRVYIEPVEETKLRKYTQNLMNALYFNGFFHCPPKEYAMAVVRD